MTMPRLSFDAARDPLAPGVNLVEASAGTGKTFAIAMLVLRFITEFGFALPSILVVTFTKAATEELKERIRARLASARELLLATSASPISTDPADPALASWRAGLAERGISTRLALQRLELALLDMDLAAVFTIHGFCQRMLQEQALESGQLFDFELIKDTGRQHSQVIEDYWRRHIYPLAPLHCALLTSNYPNPNALYESIKGGGRKAVRIEPPALTIEEALAGFDHSLNLLAQWWRGQAAILHSLLLQAVTADKFNKKMTENFAGWWQQLDNFLGDGGRQLPDNINFLTPNELMAALNGHKFRSGGGLSSEEKKQAFIATLPLPEQELAAFLQSREEVNLAFRMGLLRELSTGLSLALGRQNRLSFDDLIVRLEEALRSKQGTALRQIISKRYQAAMIDEFQDTDDSQYTIFSTLFAGPGTATEACRYLYLIGDPKQAIYNFRGADIYSYFKARQQADLHLNLAHNYRSHPALLAAVNQLFRLRANAFATAELPYLPVSAAKSRDDGRLLANGRPLPVMVYCQLETTPDSKSGQWNVSKAGTRIISSVITEITRLLQADRSIMLSSTADKQAATTQLEPRDIAILVRSHKQAEQFQLALARAGIPAILTSKQSVFTTPECHELLQLLQALGSPGDLRLLKAALTISWFALDGPELYACWQDAEQVDQWLSRCHDYHQIWQEQGFLTMMTRLLAWEKILLQLSLQPLAERRIANIHHLLELIQAAATEQVMGPAKTLQWLRAMTEDYSSLEDTELRLESDDEAVKIVTMHSAKGLEYPVVFCPFLWYRGNRLRQAQGLVHCHNDRQELILDLGSPLFAERKEQALQEELAEELRLAYVALTRARSCCYTYWADVGSNTCDSRNSALAWLLSLEQEGSFADQVNKLEAAAADGSVVYRLIPAEADDNIAMPARQPETEQLACLTFTAGNLHSDWLLHSYSSLTAAPGYHPPAQFSRPAETPDLLDLSPTSVAILLPELPTGAPMGNVVHNLLENIPFSALAAGSGFDEMIKQQCAWFGVEVNPPRLAALLQKTVQTPLLSMAAGTTFCLADLEPAEIIKEMPFYFHLQPSATAQINAILAATRAVAPITAKTLQGYLTGFVDLICRYHGKFYVIDYKSNRLGNQLAAYGPEALEQAMREHNYGLQYWLYTLVLHRYLQNSLAGYDYDRHFGGVMYLFLRGMEPTVPGSGVYFALPERSTLDRLDGCLGRSKSIPGASDTTTSMSGGRPESIPGASDNGQGLAEKGAENG